MNRDSNISALRVGFSNIPISVKVQSLWIPIPNNMGKHCRLILADKQGLRVEATIPHPYYLRRFLDNFFEGGWYLLKGYRVMFNPEQFKNTKNPMFIKFTFTTTMVPTEVESDPCLLDFVKFPAILNNEHETVDIPVDLYGTILKVSRQKRLPYVKMEHEPDYVPHYRDIYITDYDRNLLKATAIGEACTAFTANWREARYDTKIRGDMVFCVLKFWLISGIEGDRSLISGNGFSRNLLNPKIPEFEEEEYICRFMNNFSKHLVEDSEEEVYCGIQIGNRWV